MRAWLCLALTLLVAGCAPRSAGSVVAPRQEGSPPADASLGSFIAKVRTLSGQAAARPASFAGTTLESSDARLSGALAIAAVSPSPDTFRDVADAYERRGVFDKAHEYLQAALRLDERDPATYEALARLWRDARMPHLALADAYRATYYGPQWPVAHNTLGTILQALGQRAQARGAYERALQLDPAAAYALNNLCYGWVLDGHAKKAILACAAALRLNPSLRVARNNLGLAQASAGSMDAARDSFRAAGDEAGAQYNLGIAYLAHRQYGSAVKAFEAAHALRPSLTVARVRANEARARGSEEPAP